MNLCVIFSQGKEWTGTTAKTLLMQQNINLSTIILVLVAISSFVFSFWSYKSIKKHTKGLASSSDTLTQEKYFELKSKQEYIVAVATVVISIITFFGYQNIQGIKENLSEELKNERQTLDSIKREVSSALVEYQKLKSASHDYSTDLTSSIKTLDVLKARVKIISGKNIIQQNIYIVEKVNMSKYKYGDGMYAKIYFKDLITIDGQKLPKFSSPPSILCTSSTNAWPLLTDVTTESFMINVENRISQSGVPDANKVLVDFWISQKPTVSFSKDFNDDFK